MRHVLVSVAATAVLTASVMASTAFNTNFSSGYETYLETRGGYVVVEPEKFGTSANAYLCVAATHDTNYLDGDWTAEVGFSTFGNREYMFVSAGIGDPSAAWSADPTSTAMYTRGGKWYANQDMAVLTVDTGGTYTQLEDFTGYSGYGGVLTITKSGDELTFEMVRTGGTYSSGPWSVSQNAPWLDETNSRFFVGASDPDAWITYIAFDTGVAGDYNSDGMVTDADYTIWANTYGSWTDLRADGNNDGEITDADYTIWADNYGAGAADPVEVPEPMTMALVTLGMMAAIRRRDAA